MTRQHVLIKSKIPYASHAANFATGCIHACKYCYMGRRPDARPVSFATALLEADLGRLKEKPQAILVSSSHDAYQPDDGLPTRQVLEILAQRGLPAWVLTKGCHRVNGGLLPVRDFDLLQGPGCRFGVSITTHDERERERWEPGASSIHHRFMTLVNAKLQGIVTWVSVEPILPGLNIAKLAHQLQGVADHIIVGRWNYSPQAAMIDWAEIKTQVQEAFEGWGTNLFIKKELNT